MGFSRNSSAPSSRHLQASKRRMRTTTGVEAGDEWEEAPGDPIGDVLGGHDDHGNLLQLGGLLRWRYTVATLGLLSRDMDGKTVRGLVSPSLSWGVRILSSPASSSRWWSCSRPSSPAVSNTQGLRWWWRRRGRFRRTKPSNSRALFPLSTAVTASKLFRVKQIQAEGNRKRRSTMPRSLELLRMPAMTARSTELSSTASTCRCPPSLPPAQQPSPLPTEDISSDSDEATRPREREGRRRIYTHAGSMKGSVQGIRLGGMLSSSSPAGTRGFIWFLPKSSSALEMTC